MDATGGPRAGSASAAEDRRRALRALRRGPGPGWLAVVAAAAAWGLILASDADAPPETLRALLFAGAPFVLLAGLHSRLEGYLHAPQRLALLPLAVAPGEHWALARARHRRGLALTLAIAALTPVVALGGRVPPALLAALVGDVLWILALAALCEPLIPAAAAWLGRRFPPGSSVGELQRSLGGGWTSPEATVHLYAPALGIALALALAMPGELALELRGATPAALPWLLGPLALAGLLRLVAPRLYAIGLWEAVPRLAEATRSLAGPPEVEPVPALVDRLGPIARLDLRQLLRLRPLFVGRLALVALVIAWALRARPLGPAPLIAGLLALALWLAPFAELHHQRRARARLLGALPLAAPLRRGRPGPVALALAILPPLAWLAIVAARLLA